MGRGNADAAYLSASDAMFKAFQNQRADMYITIGSDMEKRLASGTQICPEPAPRMDLAIKALDGKITCARGGHNATSIVAVGETGSFLATDIGYMMKIAVGPEVKDMLDIDLPPSINIKRVARAKNKYIEDTTVCVLDREYNQPLVQQIRETGARIVFIRDGDISGVISTAMPGNPIDILIGMGGRKEGVLAAAALKCLGGDMLARYVYRKEDEESENMAGIDYKKTYTISDLVRGQDTIVSITGVTDGVLLPGVHYISGGAETSSIVLQQKTRTIREIKALHQFDYNPGSM